MKAISADTGISWSDLDKMHIAHHATQRHKRYFTPFAFNDKQLARVIALATWRRSHGGNPPMPENISYLELRELAHRRTNELRAKDISHMPAHAQAKLERMHVALQTAGGFMELQAQIAYRSWRLGQHSTTIAEALNCTPQQVRVNLARLKKIARQLGFDAPVTAAPGSVAKQTRAHKRNGRIHWSPAMLDKAQRMRKAGRTLQAIADALGLPTPQAVSCKLNGASRRNQHGPSHCSAGRCTYQYCLARH